ncbi:MAG TPA: choice-of-anchor tandem repeat GloVer-containing protein [Rhizomicrobium sp.]|nr:choice-of-anchor tandem repeat GloVer-containing protein [Rhizomicrobium sp.]
MHTEKFTGRRSVGHLLLSGAIVIAPFILPGVACAEGLLYSFGPPPDGALASGVIRGSDGTLYGTTSWGGQYGCNEEGNCVGTVYKITPHKKEVILHRFGDTGGYYPCCEPAMDSSGNLYGTTSSGAGADYYGVVFKLTPAGIYTELHSFTDGPDGGQPSGTVVDAKGNIFGVAETGGANNDGVLYEITSQGSFEVLHSFAGTDGSYPVGTPMVDDKGNVYGTTLTGGANNVGVVYEVTPKGEEKVLHSFAYQTDGSEPLAGVVQDGDGNLYGTTQGSGPNGGGTLYELAPSGDFIVLHAFSQTGGDGWAVDSPPTLVRNGKGKIELYGITSFGGTYNAGTAYKYWGMGHYKIIHSFAGGSSDAYLPQGSLAAGPGGRFYGASNQGGPADNGTVFEFKSR